MAHCLLEITNLVLVGDLCIFGILYGAGRAFIFSGIDIEKCWLMPLIVELMKKLLLY